MSADVTAERHAVTAAVRLTALRVIAVVGILAVAAFGLALRLRLHAGRGRQPAPGRRRGHRPRGRRRLRPLLGDEPDRQLAAGPLARGRPAVRVRGTGARAARRSSSSTPSSTRSSSASGTRGATSLVGLDNYRFAFTDESMLRSMRNTAVWIVLVPLVAVSVGLAFATLADRLQPRRGRRQVAHLPADGDLVRRRRRHVPPDLQLPTRGLRHEHRAAQRHLDRASGTSRWPG